MAICQYRKVEVMVPVPTPRTVETFVLTLTREEAETLRIVTTVVGGLAKGRRGHMDAIGQALAAAGQDYPALPHSDLDAGAIQFKDTITSYRGW